MQPQKTTQQTTHPLAGDEEIARSRQLADDLERTVHALESKLGRGLDVRRVRTDLDHLRESLALLQEAAAARRGRPGPAQGASLVEIPDAPYDPGLWQDAGDEGIGSR